jgi:hypothetical protein
MNKSRVESRTSTTPAAATTAKQPTLHASSHSFIKEAAEGTGSSFSQSFIKEAKGKGSSFRHSFIKEASATRVAAKTAWSLPWHYFDN